MMIRLRMIGLMMILIDALNGLELESIEVETPASLE